MRKILMLLALCVFMVMPALAQEVTGETPAGMSTIALVVSAVLLVLSTVLGAKYYIAEKKVTEGAEVIGGIVQQISNLFFEIRVFIKMVPESLKDKKLTVKELELILAQLELIVVKLKAVLSFFKKKGIEPL